MNACLWEFSSNPRTKFKKTMFVPNPFMNWTFVQFCFCFHKTSTHQPTTNCWLSNFFSVLIFCPFFLHRAFPGELLYHGSCQSSGWSASLPPLHLQWAGHSAAGYWTGTFARLPLRGSEWQASSWRLPTFQRGQPGWWQVSNQRQQTLSGRSLKLHGWVCVFVFSHIK